MASTPGAGSETASPIHFGLVIKQEGRLLPEIEEYVRFTVETGWDSAWGYDHFYSLGSSDMEPTFEGWTLLADMAAISRGSRLQLGLMVTGNTHRNPAVLAKEAVTVDHIADGRLILGLGAAWNEPEHRAYGIPFPSARERVDRFGEAVELIHLLETQERTTFNGEYYSLDNAPFEPKPVNGHIPLLVGSTGKRMLRHIARYADLWDGGGTPEEYAAAARYLAGLCQEIGRDPSEIVQVLSTGSRQLESADTLRQHVTSYAEVGVRWFLFDAPRGPLPRSLVDLAEHAIPALRQELG